ncbi:MAG: TIR domain-containing protein [Chloroflexota bacterium]
MAAKLHVFISYKKHDGETPAYATNIAHTLKEKYDFEVFIDVLRIDTADHWEQKIYNEIHRADVLVLLLEPLTATSEWVQREVDYARGSCVSVLPLLMVDRKQVNISEATDKLALSGLQHSPYFQQSESDYDALAADLRRLALDTRDAQRRQHRQREKHWHEVPTDLNLKQRSYRMKNGHLPDLRIHLSVGNILDMPAGTLDVIVNSENDYLQMARFYEVNTLSARLRKTGAYFDKNKRLVEDTVQRDLDAYDDVRPVSTTQVIVTKAGHELSDLRLRKKVKFIFHAITVQFNIGSMGDPVIALGNNEVIQETIKCCFDKISQVNQDAALRESVDPEFKAIKSIAFPLFGTGMGGRGIKEIAPAMVGGLSRAISEYNEPTLRDIYLLVYSPNEVVPIEEALNATFKRADS